MEQLENSEENILNMKSQIDLYNLNQYKNYIQLCVNTTNLAEGSLYLFKDSNETIFFINNPLYVLNSNTYEISKKIRYQDVVELNSNEKILSFEDQMRQLFVMIYNRNSIFIFPTNNPKLSEIMGEYIFCQKKMSFLKDGETIVKIHSISNEVTTYL
jgi:hypothetical protein